MKKISTEEMIRFKKSSLRCPIIKELANRFSPRFYSGETIEDKDLNFLIEAARWAPSAYNHQPWYFYWTQKGSPNFRKILSTLPQYNLWSERASVLIIACYLDKINCVKNKFARYDLGAAVMSLITQATSMGYYARQIGIFNKKKLMKLLSIDKDHPPFVIIALGKLGDYTKIDERLLQRELQPRRRKEDLSRKI